MSRPSYGDLGLMEGPAWSEDAPRAFLSAQKLYKFRTYVLSVILTKRWRALKRVGVDDVYAAALNAKCCRSGAVEGAGVSCDRCGTIVFISRDIFAPAGNVPEEVADGVEKYSVQVRTRCTSSKDHLGSSLVLRLDRLAADKPVTTRQFAVLGPRKKVGSTRKRALSGGVPPLLDSEDQSGSEGYSSRGTEYGDGRESPLTLGETPCDSLLVEQLTVQLQEQLELHRRLVDQKRASSVALPTPPRAASTRSLTMSPTTPLMMSCQSAGLPRGASAASSPQSPASVLLPTQRIFHLLASREGDASGDLFSKASVILEPGCSLHFRLFRYTTTVEQAHQILAAAAEAIRAPGCDSDTSTLCSLPEGYVCLVSTHHTDYDNDLSSMAMHLYLSNSLPGRPNLLATTPPVLEVAAEFLC